MKYGNDINHTVTNDLQRQVDDLRKEIRDDIQKDIRFQYLLDVFIFTYLSTVVDENMKTYCGLMCGLCAIIWLCKLLLSIYR